MSRIPVESRLDRDPAHSAIHPAIHPAIHLDLKEAGSNDFLAVGPALRILQLNVEGLSAAKRSIIRDLAERHKRRRHLPLCTRLFATIAEIYKIK